MLKIEENNTEKKISENSDYLKISDSMSDKNVNTSMIIEDIAEDIHPESLSNYNYQYENPVTEKNDINESDSQLIQTHQHINIEQKIKKNLRKRSKINENGIDLIPEIYSSLDCTKDIVKNMAYANPRNEILPKEIDLIFFQPVVEGMALELSNFYTSFIKINKLKARLSNKDDEPTILSNNPKSRPINPIIKTENIQTTEEDVYDVKSEIKHEIKFENFNSITNEDNIGIKTLNPRTLQVLNLVQKHFLQSRKNTILFEDLAKKPNRKVISCGFYEILQLAINNFILLDSNDGKLLLKQIIK